MARIVSWAARLPVLLMAVLAASCATQTPYAPADGGRLGYSEQQIENNRYTVSFAGNSLTDRQTVETYLLYRAAELTLQSGYDYFVVVEQDTEKSTTYRSTIYDYPYRHHFFLSWYGYPYGPHFGGGLATETTRPIERYRAVAEIVMYEGEKPESDPAAFDARSVIEHLGPGVRRPE
ncbi:MAG: CC0125/CC1285 family lipoprotein [Alphaproteobacteria bacterium]